MQTHCALAIAGLFLASALAAQGQGIVLQNGVDAHFDVPYTPELIPSGGITLEAWITYDDSTITAGTYKWPTVCRQNPTPGQESYFLRVAAANTAARVLQFKVETTSGGRAVTFPFLAGAFSTWTHVAGTWDGTTQNLYVNGALVATASLGGGRIVDRGGELRVGNGDVSAPGAETWNGEIDELRIWPFARSASEIADSMNDEISGLPTGAITFGLNGIYIDSSSGLIGNPTGPIGFANNSLALAPRLALSFGVGPGSTTCLRPVAQGIGGPAVIGRAGFSWVATGVTPASSGFLLLSFGTAAPTPIFGITIHLSTSGLLAFGTTATAIGTARIPLAIPNRPALVGAGLSSQFVFIDATCGSQGLVASDAMTVGIQQ
ncbi:MAG: LamG domain-containing protein [Planctomycetota bacterium]